MSRLSRCDVGRSASGTAIALFTRALVAGALALATSGAMADLATGLGAIERSDYASARRELEPLAQQGDHEAQFAMGRMLLNGWGAPADAKVAARWFSLAAEGGHEKARRMMAELHDRGLGVAADPSAARRWRCLADQAADRPSESAPRFTHEWICEQASPAEIERIRAGAASGDPASQTLLGTLLAQGKGLAQDPKQALQLFRDAARHGNAEANHNLGVMHELGLGVPADLRAARGWYRTSTLPDSLRSANRVDLLLGIRGLAWGAPLGGRPGFAPTPRPPVLLEEVMRLQSLLTGRRQSVFHEYRDEPMHFESVPVKRVVYQSQARVDALCAVWIDFERRSRFEQLAATLLARHGPPHASTGLGEGYASMQAWRFRGGASILLHHFKPGAADESMGVLAILHEGC